MLKICGRLSIWKTVKKSNCHKSSLLNWVGNERISEKKLSRNAILAQIIKNIESPKKELQSPLRALIKELRANLLLS